MLLRRVSNAGGQVTITAWLRDCNSSIPVEAAGKIPAITDHCVSGVFNYLYKPLKKTVKVEATVCPCHTDLCNAGNITLDRTDSSTTTQSSHTTNPSSKISNRAVQSNSTSNPPGGNRLILGLSVGLGCGILLIIIIVFIIITVVVCRRRRRRRRLTSGDDNDACDDSCAGPMELNDDDDACILAVAETKDNANKHKPAA